MNLLLILEACNHTVDKFDINHLCFLIDSRTVIWIIDSYVQFSISRPFLRVYNLPIVSRSKLSATLFLVSLFYLKMCQGSIWIIKYFEGDIYLDGFLKVNTSHNFSTFIVFCFSIFVTWCTLVYNLQVFQGFFEFTKGHIGRSATVISLTKG